MHLSMVQISSMQRVPLVVSVPARIPSSFLLIGEANRNLEESLDSNHDLYAQRKWYCIITTNSSGIDTITIILYHSLCSYKSWFKWSDSSRFLLASPIKRKLEWIYEETETTSASFYTTNQNLGEVHNIDQSSLLIGNFIFHSLNIIWFCN